MFPDSLFPTRVGLILHNVAEAVTVFSLRELGLIFPIIFVFMASLSSLRKWGLIHDQHQRLLDVCIFPEQVGLISRRTPRLARLGIFPVRMGIDLRTEISILRNRCLPHACRGLILVVIDPLVSCLVFPAQVGS